MAASASDVTSREVQLKRNLEQVGGEPQSRGVEEEILAFLLAMFYNSQRISLAVKAYTAIAGGVCVRVFQRERRKIQTFATFWLHFLNICTENPAFRAYISLFSNA